ncbi:MAG TPA: hypothetical protein VEB19_08230, partial [Gemmatimonadaceae bacterium]|nr:hypothetical protein [Gemmatimonadaceae bacterium]
HRSSGAAFRGGTNARRRERVLLRSIGNDRVGAREAVVGSRARYLSEPGTQRSWVASEVSDDG